MKFPHARRIREEHHSTLSRNIKPNVTWSMNSMDYHNISG
jgi:hypothetical protein